MVENYTYVWGLYLIFTTLLIEATLYHGSMSSAVVETINVGFDASLSND